MQMKIGIAPAAGEKVESVRLLWREYWDCLGFSDEFQGFGAELAGLPGKYVCLLLASVDDEPAGAIGVRPLEGDSCEIKRLYVRPAFRGVHLGRALLDRALTEARELGYRRVFADTMPSMTTALRMYRQVGFSDVERYSETPTTCAIYLRLEF
jgi:ribosomal protein S18 acetylase RimI-like enzyme